MRECVSTCFKESSLLVRRTPKKPFKDVAKTGEKDTENTLVWGMLVFCWLQSLWGQKVEHSNLKRPTRKGDVDSISEDIQSGLDCKISVKVVLPSTWFSSHWRLHENRQSYADYVGTLPGVPERNLCQFWDQFSGLPLRRSRIWKCRRRKSYSRPSTGSLSVTYVKLKEVCRGEVGLQRHLRSHGRSTPKWWLCYVKKCQLSITNRWKRSAACVYIGVFLLVVGYFN